MTLRQIVGPVEYPVSVEDVIANSRVDGADYGLLIAALIGSAVARAERETGRAFAPQVWVQYLDRFPAGDIVIPLGPISDHVEITYDLPDGGETEVPPAAYAADTVADDARISPIEAWPVAADRKNAVRVRIEVGAGECPQDVRQAILLMVGHWYEQRETASDKTMTEIPLGAAALLSMHRRMFV